MTVNQVIKATLFVARNVAINRGVSLETDAQTFSKEVGCSEEQCLNFIRHLAMAGFFHKNNIVIEETPATHPEGKPSWKIHGEMSYSGGDDLQIYSYIGDLYKTRRINEI